MARRYEEDDEDDQRLRGANASGGVPTWVWIAGGVGAFVVLLSVALGVGGWMLARTAEREEAQARMRAEDAAAEAAARREKVVADDNLPPLGPIDAADMASEYAKTPQEAALKYQRKRVTVRMRVGDVTQNGADTVQLVQETDFNPVVFTVPNGDAQRVTAKNGTVSCTGVIKLTGVFGIYLEGRVDP